MRIRPTIFKALLLGSCLVMIPRLGLAETLQQAASRALETHPSVTAALAGVDMALQERKAEASGYFPTVSLSTTAGRIYGDNSTSRGLSTTRGAGYSGLWEGTASVRQMIFDGFETSNRTDSAEARRRAADLSTKDIKENLSLNASRAYVEVLRISRALKMLGEHEKKVEDYLARIKSMVDEGAADESDYQQGRDIKVILDGIIADYTSQLRSAEASYLEATSQAPDKDLVTPVLPSGFVFKTADEAIADALKNHPLVLAAAFTAESYGHDKGAEQASLYPDLDSELSYMKTDKRDIIGGEAVDARAVLRLNWNFETGGGQLSRIRRAKHQQQEAMARIDDLKGQIERDLRMAYAERDAASESLKNKDTRRELNETLMKTYTAQFEGAKITLLQLMQGDNQLFTTKLEKMNAEHRLIMADMNILARSGRLQEALAQPDAVVARTDNIKQKQP
jgi:adhesin transport system outer membrane protein